MRGLGTRLAVCCIVFVFNSTLCGRILEFAIILYGKFCMALVGGAHIMNCNGVSSYSNITNYDSKVESMMMHSQNFLMIIWCHEMQDSIIIIRSIHCIRFGPNSLMVSTTSIRWSKNDPTATRSILASLAVKDLW